MPEQSKKMFQAVFENSPVGLVIINKDTTLRSVNNYMFNMFKLSPKAIEGQRFGNVFNCSIVSGQDEICGDIEICNHCGMRAGVQAVLNEGITIPDTVMDHNFTIKDLEQKKWFKISASQIVSEGDIFAIVSFVDITTQKEYEDLLNNQLSLDMATGTTNKYSLLSTLKLLTAGKENLTIAMIDFDDFKVINDTYGHVVGDKVIDIFCVAASANTRKKDILGRFGGEEFMLVSTGSSTGLLIKALRRIYQLFQEECNKKLNINPTFSVGIAQFSSEKMAEMNVDDIIAEVDTNLYLSKSRGKDKITVEGISIPFKN
ncbi:diguanylate cyclase (GGDEF) domain-containing protein [Desulfonispora thiosulfatigenes DSM 11270]|uniref:Diguanylate cyclase (GGDEF) domain-containing protein n=1 Tax=Desulfonispora thiosulfatigenes DSM 11270 TaxID=656914 RepID=A0A1W1UVP6_DESTI|nr:sensor domain-containing diguanylate cyclase [Desulfonispora thiosulfatigenes]SMB85120.1 diguanylate cyclase (GGDEF) domain-containing protein [Desulfonispora thiosulfatigenes DSM 11270]